MNAPYGWRSDFPTIRVAKPRVVRGWLQGFLPNAEASQVRARDDSIPRLQREVRKFPDAYAGTSEYSVILKYELSLEFRRPDMLLLVGSAVIVLELKGKEVLSQAYLDQTAANARDLCADHRDYHSRPVYAVVVPTPTKRYAGERGGVHIAGPDAIDALTANFADTRDRPPLAMDYGKAVRQTSENAWIGVPEKSVRVLIHGVCDVTPRAVDVVDGLRGP
jgi:hypothetical protein